MKALLVAYDNQSHIAYFPLGIAYVAATLEKQGHYVEIYPQDQFHWPEAHLTEYIKERDFDVVGVGMCAGYVQYRKMLAICKAVRASGKKIQIWLGGHMVAPDPDYFERKFHADYVCAGEYEKVPIDDIPFPAWHLFDMDYYSLVRAPRIENTDRCFPVLSGRGCPYSCTFCYRMVPGWRARSVQSIVEEVKELKRSYYVNYIEFADELLMVSPDRTQEICRALQPLKVKWNCNGRLNIAASSPEILKDMRKAGCVFINYGIESLDEQVLRQMNKHLTPDQIVKGIEETLKVGISPGLNLIWGNIGDTKRSLWKSVQFLLKYDDQGQMRTIRPVQPYPGSALFLEAKKRGLIKDVADFYENKHVHTEHPTVNFTDIPDDEFMWQLYIANRTLLKNYHQKQCAKTVEAAYKVYVEKDTSFMGFRRT